METMPQTRRNVKDNMDNDFVYEMPKKPSRSTKNPVSTNVTSSADSGKSSVNISSLPPASDIRSPDILRSIRALEQRILELESEHTMKEIMMMSRNQGAQVSDDRASQGDTSAKASQDDSASIPSVGLACNTQSHGKIKSGYSIMDHTEVVRIVLWPHGFLSTLQNYTDVKPDSLNIEAFFHGYMSILLQVQDETERKGRLHHAKQLLWHSIHHGWSSARGFHYQVLRDIEVGNITWGDLQEMQALALASAEGSSSSVRKRPFSSKKQEVNVASSDSTNKQSAIFCYLYNNDENGCRYEKEFGHCKKLHACSSCAMKGFLNKHRALECRK